MNQGEKLARLLDNPKKKHTTGLKVGLAHKSNKASAALSHRDYDDPVTTS